MKTNECKPECNGGVASSAVLGDGMKYKSKAQWPAIVAACHGASVTEDTHDTYEQARAVCDMLEREGLGGDREIFPVSTWVEQSPNTSSSATRVMGKIEQTGERRTNASGMTANVWRIKPEQPRVQPDLF